MTAIRQYGLLAFMKATIDIPDDLYRLVKAKSALEGRPVRAVAVDLFTRYVGAESPKDAGEPDESAVPSSPESGASGERQTPPWFGLARDYARGVKDHGMRAVRDSIERGWARDVADKEGRIHKGAGE